MTDKEATLAVKSTWGPLQFSLTMLGFAVGLANIWRFPNVVHTNGGGAFFIPYVFSIIFIGIPLFLFEATLGQYSKKGAIQVWDINPLFRGIGLAATWVVTIMSVYYTTPQAWSLFYFAMSFNVDIPWKNCTSPTAASWASDECIAFNGNISAENYFYDRVVQKSSGAHDWGEFNWELFLCNMVVWFLIFCIVSFGAKSIGKIVYFSSIFPFLMLIAMVSYGATLPGSIRGIEYYFKPDFEVLKDVAVWRDAVAQVFMSTGLGCAVVIQMSAYNNFHNNVVRDAILVPIFNAITSILGGFAVFTVLGYMAHEAGNDEFPSIIHEGPGLIFITYAEAFAQFSVGYILSALFYFMCLVIGISSTVPACETVCAVFGDAIPFFGRSRLRNVVLRFILCTVLWLLGTFFYFGNGFYWFTLIDNRVVGYLLMLIGLLEIVTIWFYGPFRLIGNVQEMAPVFYKFGIVKWYWVICWTVIVPAGILFIFILDILTNDPLTFSKEILPEWLDKIGWGVFGVAPLLVFVTAQFTFCWKYNGRKLLRETLKPNAQWPGHDAKKVDVEMQVISDPSNLTNFYLPPTADAIRQSVANPAYVAGSADSVAF